MKSLELVERAPRGIAACHNLRGQLHGRDVDDAFLRRLQHAERVVTIADHTADYWRLEIDHRVP
jgi:hypothetical protein